ncbi:MAG: hypothetical protein ACP5VF_06210 [Acidobacteriota bacterium]
MQKTTRDSNYRYLALLFVPEKGCTCTYLEAFAAAQKAITQKGISCRLVLVIPPGGPAEALAGEGVPREALYEDQGRAVADAIGVDSGDLPYFVVLPVSSPARRVIAYRLAGPAGVQSQTENLLDVLLFLPGGRV